MSKKLKPFSTKSKQLGLFQSSATRKDIIHMLPEILRSNNLNFLRLETYHIALENVNSPNNECM